MIPRQVGLGCTILEVQGSSFEVLDARQEPGRTCR